MKFSPSLALGANESTGIVNCEQVIVFGRYVRGNQIEEEIFLYQSLTVGTKSEKIFNSLSDSLEFAQIEPL